MAKTRENIQYFESQDADERVIFIIRKHFLILSASFISAFFLALLILAIYLLMSFTNVLESELSRAVAVSVACLSFLYVLLYSFVAWLVKYLDILILTNKHLVIIRQDGLFHRSTSVLDLSTIQDVSTQQYGAIQTFLGFGKINIQTAGETPNFAYNGVSKPIQIQDAIMDAKELYVNKNKNVSSPIITKDLGSKTE